MLAAAAVVSCGGGGTKSGVSSADYIKATPAFSLEQLAATPTENWLTVCCGWLSRGVAVGEGKVYLGRLDGKLVALDQKTGEQVWSTQVERWQNGYPLTSAPRVRHPRPRDRLRRLDREDEVALLDDRAEVVGRQVVPQRRRTRVADAVGGRRPRAPVLHDGERESRQRRQQARGQEPLRRVVRRARPAHGNLRWGYQMVHHDIWDYDAPSPTVLFDAEVDGKQVKGIGEASKTGWLYLLDRTNGKPLFPMPEQPVPQEPRQKTWPTQPFPSYAPFVPHTLSDAQYAQLVKQVQAAQRNAKTAQGVQPTSVVRAKEMFTPYWKTPVAFTPGPQGGTNWQPSSYNPNTHMFYVCAQSGPTANTAETELPAKQKRGGSHPTTIGSTLTIGGGFGSNVGIFAAIDATTGKVAWQKRWPESCDSGSATTKGNLVFIGRNDWRLQAYDARNGKLLWSWQTGAGANNAPSIVERNGKEVVVFYAGGNALAASPHGDNLWLLSLDGTMDAAKAAGSGQGVGHAGENSQQQPRGNTAGDADAGKNVFAQNCSPCHGAGGRGGNGGPDLSGAGNLTRVIAQVMNGGGGMPPFKDNLTQKQIRDVSTYVTEDVAK